MTDAAPPPAAPPPAAPPPQPAAPALDRTPDPQLDPQRIISTIHALRNRIHERFPGSGLAGVADELKRVADATVARVTWVAKPNLPLRVAAWLLVGVIVFLVIAVVRVVQPAAQRLSLSDFLQALEAGLNDLLLIGAALFFVVTVEARIKRRRALGFLRELRALAHVVDMHQLTKDPATLLHPERRTPSSPQRSMTRYELARYLDYCSEILSLDGKLAALYAQTFDDPVVLSAVDELERLTTALSGKVWQKLAILAEADAPGA
ncbi:MAG TPA: hypothetical protein VHG91_10110 [Longimicrobium sp.]|nr:hypothetical protein [Longimicrobium sp.]